MPEFAQWIPYTQRMGIREPFVLTSNLSERPGAKEVLQEWVKNSLPSVKSEDAIKSFLLQVGVNSFKRIDLKLTYVIDYRSTFITWAEESDENLLDSIDFILRYINNWDGHEKLKDFNFIMESSNLNYQCSPEQPYRLMHRVLPATQEQYLHAVESVPEVTAKLLSKAWAEAYGYKGNPEQAWNDSRRAVENILKPIVHPKSNNSTITRLITDIEVKPEKFACSIPLKPGDMSSPVLKFVELLKMMPYEEVHHGGNITLKTVEPTCENARTQVLLAATICQIVADGNFSLAE
ncbi:hypothetical protein [Rothia nasimurium]|uniref:hypothetical protein n=1 Tax=Rothia nasimurium TaxID=85336 RepID=UPI001F3A6298|nr:hypothetical protein [Rothia nasimurium]